MEPRAKIMLASPLFSGDVCGQFVWSAMNSQLLCLSKGILLEFKWIQNLSLVQCARDWLLQVFRNDETFTHILFVDSDLGWTPNAIHRMVERNVDVVGGVYPRKMDDPKSRYPYMQMNGAQVEDGLLEVARLPTGFLLLSREAVDRVSRNKPVYKMKIEGGELNVSHVFDIRYHHDIGDIISEDYAFCDELRELGYRLYAETDINFVHCGRRQWQGNLAARIDQARHDASPPSLSSS